MTNLLLKTELFIWLQRQIEEWESGRERERRAQTQAENSEKMQGSIFDPLFQFKVH